MELNDQEIRDSWKWFFGAGLLAIGLCFFLYSVDELRSNSNAEKELAETLRTIRVAQFTIEGDQAIDERLTGLYAAPLHPEASDDDMAHTESEVHHN